MKAYLTPHAELMRVQTEDIMTLSLLNLTDALVQGSDEFWGIEDPNA